MCTLITYEPGVLAVTFLKMAMPVVTSTCSVALSAVNVPGASTIESNSSVQFHVSPCQSRFVTVFPPMTSFTVTLRLNGMANVAVNGIISAVISLFTTLICDRVTVMLNLSGRMTWNTMS
ncbi:hypothetical protein NP493_1110g00017 [Ridgeia piscesae]|uniref:Uncharacterized protein n=1 Tax=Ridgeia piscesae TaxID=27915 RepID=A0AAD9KHT0_RIDPI|nr:hypothetical protein NP493_1110g00017 [Ridgeia piscesae]